MEKKEGIMATEVITTRSRRVEEIIRHMRAERQRNAGQRALRVKLAQDRNWRRLREIKSGKAQPFPDVGRIEGDFSDVMSDGAWSGRRCFIVGGGDSLKGFDFSRLRGELVIGINRAFEFCECDILFAMDGQNRFHGWLTSGRLGEDAKRKFEEFRGYKVWIGGGVPGVYSLKDNGEEGLTTSLKQGISTGGNSGYAALNLAICLGANPIYLLGFDMKGDGKGNQSWFHSGYPKDQGEGVYKSFTKRFEETAPEVARRGFCVVNLNPDSALRCFEFGEIDDIHDLGRFQPLHPGYVVVSYYTVGTGYEEEIKKLLASLRLHLLPHEIYAYPQAGTWRANLNYKSECILRAMERFPGKDIVFIDSDAVVRQYPTLFDELSKEHKYDLSACFFKYTPESGDPDELLSGTLWIQNNVMGRRLMARWHAIALNRPNVRHQMCLKLAIEALQKSGEPVRINRHPFAYTCIFDYAAGYHIEPVIEHFQASRRFRRQVGYGVNLIVPPCEVKP